MALPLFVRKLMAPVEVKLVLSALSEEARRVNNGLATNIVVPRATEDILGHSKPIAKDIQNGRRPRVIALFLMMKAARNSLASGEFAIWAGVRRTPPDSWGARSSSLSLQGHALYVLNAYCLGELTKLGEMTPEDKTAALRATNEEMQASG
jgi:hypothetical protein